MQASDEQIIGHIINECEIRSAIGIHARIESKRASLAGVYIVFAHELALPADVGTFSRRFSSPMHWTLYALMFVTPILGVITFVYHGCIFDFGLFQLDTGIKSDRAIFHPTEDIHGYLAYALFALARLHALAALWHQFCLHDGVLGRMWPTGRSQR